MESSANFPLALYKAQLALGMQTLSLFKTARQRWFELGAGLLADDIARTESMLSQLNRVEDWQALAALLPNAFWQSSQRSVDLMQGLVQTAVTNQTSFATGFQRALLEWQQASVQALSAAGNAMPIHTTLQGMLSALGVPADAFVNPAPVPQAPAPARSKGNGQLRAAS